MMQRITEDYERIAEEAAGTRSKIVRCKSAIAL